MEKLALTCHVLYKQDLLDKKNEIDELKKIFINGQINLSFNFSTEQELDKFKSNLYEKYQSLINTVIDSQDIKSINDDIRYGFFHVPYHKAYNFAKNFTDLFTKECKLTSYQSKYIEICIWNCMNIIDTILKRVYPIDDIEEIKEISINTIEDFLMSHIDIDYAVE